MNFATMGKALASDTGTAMHLTDPNGAPLYAIEGKDGWTVTDDAETKGAQPCLFYVVGQDSRTYRRRRNEMVDALRKSQQAMKAAQVEQEAKKMVAAGVTGWSHIPFGEEGEKGALLEFSDANLLRFLDAYPPAFDQVNEFIGNRANFLQRG